MHRFDLRTICNEIGRIDQLGDMVEEEPSDDDPDVVHSSAPSSSPSGRPQLATRTQVLSKSPGNGGVVNKSVQRPPTPPALAICVRRPQRPKKVPEDPDTFETGGDATFPFRVRGFLYFSFLFLILLTVRALCLF